MTHPVILHRYLTMRQKHRSLPVPGVLTAERELEALDPHGVLSAAIEAGEERALEAISKLPRPTEETE